MDKPLNDPVAIEALNRFFNDLITVADFQARLPLLRPQVEEFRVDALIQTEVSRTHNQLRGFLSGLVVTGAMPPEQGHDFNQRLDAGREEGWL